MTNTRTQNPFWRRFAILFGLGMVGVASLPLILLPLLQQSLPPDLNQLPPTTLALLSLIQPSLLLAIAVALGTALAPKLGFRSHLADVGGAQPPPSLKAEIPLAIGLGSATGGLIIALDQLFLWLSGNTWAQISLTQPRSWGTTLVGLLYGGITEELLMRWGLVTLITWMGWRLLQRAQGQPSRVIVWTAIALVALVFGVGHLPVVAATLPLSLWLILRTVGLNALAGLVFGWLYWRRSLESAMLAHASAHVIFSLVALFFATINP